MSNKQRVNPQEMGGAFFTVPRHVLYKQGMTLMRLQVYECIFQFWNAGRQAWLSNDHLMERIGTDNKGNLSKIIQYLERENLIIRKTIDGKRFIVQPENTIEEKTDIAPDEEMGLPPGIPGVFPQEYQGIPTGRHNIKKKLSKEDEVCVDAIAPQPAHTNLISEKHKILFEEKFSNHEVNIQNLLEDCLDHYQGMKKVTPHVFYMWIFREIPENYKLKKIRTKKQMEQTINPDEIEKASIARADKQAEKFKNISRQESMNKMKGFSFRTPTIASPPSTSRFDLGTESIKNIGAIS